ncbi:ParB N-terminal domain-containing protein [Plantactinospora sp. WMMB782]|uniref:ParB N-terminal domain-containing protein n=1 Tax=Plantactinospora sp. WMMB782 TaxID=3404121 RepID=UPI003B943A39
MTNQPYQLLPPLSAEEYAALRADIEAHGIRVPVDVDEAGQVLDGHHRAAIAAELGIDCPTRVVPGLDEEGKRQHAMALNLARRHLTQADRRRLIAAELRRDDSRSDRRIARIVGVDHKTVGAVRRSLSGGSPHPEPEPLTEAERRQAAERTEEIGAGLASLDKTILVQLLSGEPPASIIGWLSVAWHQFELEHHGDEEFLGPVRKVMYTDRVHAVMAWPEGWYGDECRREQDELHQLYLSRTGRVVS